MKKIQRPVLAQRESLLPLRAMSFSVLRIPALGGCCVAKQIAVLGVISTLRLHWSADEANACLTWCARKLASPEGAREPHQNESAVAQTEEIIRRGGNYPADIASEKRTSSLLVRSQRAFDAGQYLADDIVPAW